MSSTATASAPVRWLVHLPTADETCVRLVLPPQGEGDPWPTGRSLVELERLGARREGAPRVLGSGRGTPIMAAHELRWHGLQVDLEARCDSLGAVFELSLALPAWDELVLGAPDEESVWELVDSVCAAVGARFGTIGDGEATILDAPPVSFAEIEALIARHVGLLLPAAAAPGASAGASLYRSLPRSGLAVLLR